jgi:hypothetical protein
LQICIMGEFVFKCIFAVVETRHITSLCVAAAYLL